MKLITFLSVFAYCQALLNPEWISFKNTHGKSYGSRIEEAYRMNVYMENRRLIEEHNKMYEAGNLTFSMKMNRFGDLTTEEVNDLMNMYEYDEEQDVQDNELRTEFVPQLGVEIPTSMDWREKGAVTPVKNQGSCGSCWAFSATGSLEGQHFLKTGELVSLSEQNLIDCSGVYWRHRCSGSTYTHAFKYIKKNGGIDLEDDYPYEGRGTSCRFSASKVGAKLKGYVSIRTDDEEALKAAVARVGPISVAIDAGRKSFHHYNNGIYHDKKCSSQKLNHEVLVVGYGTDNGKDYWLVKNSWGEHWGDKGYIKMARNKNNHCGIAVRPGYPTL